MAKKAFKEICPACGSNKIHVDIRKGLTPVAKSRFYREAVTCKRCGLSVSGKSPGKASSFWNGEVKREG